MLRETFVEYVFHVLVSISETLKYTLFQNGQLELWGKKANDE